MPSKFQQPFSFVCRHTTLLTNLNQPRYGIHLWGMVLQREPLRQLGTTMLTLCAMTIREFFLMTDDNPHHPEDFVRNHATGV
jgi:endoglucanase Acf2